MATKSILKTVYIKNRKSAAALVQALENSRGKISKKVIISKPCSEASGEEIRKMFNKEV